jgi:hypothetical protein
MANSRKRKNFIQTLESETGIAISQEDKHKVVYNYFLQQAGTYFPRNCKLNLVELGWEPRQLDHLDIPFSESEI